MPDRDPAEFLRALLDASPFGVIALDPENRVRLWSRGAQNILNATEEEVLGHSLPLDLQLPAPGGIAEFNLTRHNGTTVDVELRTMPWHEGRLVIVTDIS